MHGRWTPARSLTSGARSQMQETCLAQGTVGCMRWASLAADTLAPTVGSCPCGRSSSSLRSSFCFTSGYGIPAVVYRVCQPAAAWAVRTCRMYATAAARSDGLLLLCGGRDVAGTPLADAYGFARHRDGRWEWHAAPGSMPSGRYQHGSVFVGTRLHISGGAVGGGRMVSSDSRA